MSYDRDNDIEKIFYQDSKSKKRVGANVTKRASRRGYIRGGIRTQSDFLTNKQRKLLSGEVRIYSMYEDINKLPTWEDLMLMPDEKKKEILKKAKEFHSSTKLQKHWNISSGKLYGWYDKYKLYEKKTSKKVTKTSNKKTDKVYEDISDVPSYTEFLDMDRGNRTQLLIQVRNDVSMSKLRKHWRISQGTLYKLLYDFGIIEKNSAMAGKKAETKKHTIEVSHLDEKLEDILVEVPADDNELYTVSEDIVYEDEKSIPLEIDNVKDEIPTIPVEKEFSSNNNFSITLKGKFTRQEVENRIFRALMTMDLDKLYDFELTIKE